MINQKVRLQVLWYYMLNPQTIASVYLDNFWSENASIFSPNSGGKLGNNAHGYLCWPLILIALNQTKTSLAVCKPCILILLQYRYYNIWQIFQTFLIKQPNMDKSNLAHSHWWKTVILVHPLVALTDSKSWITNQNIINFDDFRKPKLRFSSHWQPLQGA